MLADLLSLIKEIRDPIEPKVKTISFGGQAFHIRFAGENPFTG